MPDMIAERILRLVASPEEAASIAGDLRELSVTRGRLWFWFSVARTGSSLLWKDLTSAPLFLAVLGLRGLLVTVCLGWLIRLIAIRMPLSLARSAEWNNLAVQALLIAMWLITTSLAQFVTGRYLATRSRGREAAALVAYIAVSCLMRAGFLTYFAARSSIVVFSWGNVMGVIANLAPLLMGAMLTRFRRNRKLSNA